MLAVVELTYTAGPEEIERHLEAHRDYLRRYYAKGMFLLSGPQVPKVGGVIIARAENQASLQEAIDEDPFKRAGVAEYRVIAFEKAFCAEVLEDWLQQEKR